MESYRMINKAEHSEGRRLCSDRDGIIEQVAAKHSAFSRIYERKFDVMCRASLIRNVTANIERSRDLSAEDLAKWGAHIADGAGLYGDFYREKIQPERAVGG